VCFFMSAGSRFAMLVSYAGSRDNHSPGAFADRRLMIVIRPVTPRHSATTSPLEPGPSPGILVNRFWSCDFIAEESKEDAFAADAMARVIAAPMRLCC
jgi:hypothetical protein